MKKTHDFDSVFDSQEVFRLILDATAHPLTPVNLKPYTRKIPFNEPQFLAIAMTLLDNEVSFNTCENGELSHNIRSLTLSSREDIADADFVCEQYIRFRDVIQNAKCGTDTNPHDAAAVLSKLTMKKKTSKPPGTRNSKRIVHTGPPDGK
jgi:alpha-D-ribose 1-methylphosphonate 5-triphosphate synthase subunit PhnH